jgi:hypothetical protein
VIVKQGSTLKMRLKMKTSLILGLWNAPDAIARLCSADRDSLPNSLPTVDVTESSKPMNHVEIACPAQLQEHHLP